MEPGIAPVNPVDTGLKNDFGLTYLYPYQRLVVTNVLESVAAARGTVAAGEDGPGDQIVVLPTGAGKSLCFQLPAVLLGGVTVVVYPLLSLMADQYRRLNEKGLSAVMLRGGQKKSERQEAFGKLTTGTAKIVITNPETLANEELSKRIADSGVDHLVIDEAHCISEWGETFRPAYLGLGDAKERLAAAVCTAFTATASPPIMAGIVRHLFAGHKPHVIAGNPDRTNIRYFTIPSICTTATLVELFKGKSPSGNGDGRRPGRAVNTPAIVFCRSRDGAALTALELRRRLGRRDIYFYHAGLSKPEKTRIEEWFFGSTTGILCATCAYGMGVDKSDIRTVIHFETPPSIEAYLQESGRAGRDRSSADAILIYKPRPNFQGGARLRGKSRAGSPVESRSLSAGSMDITTPYSIPVVNDTSGPAERLAAMEAYPYLAGCRREYLVSLLGGEVEHCGGCDSCLGLTGEKPSGEEEIVGTVSEYGRCFSKHELGLFLRQAGVLTDWEPEEVQEAIRNLVLIGRLRVASRLLWKSRLYVPILLGSGGSDEAGIKQHRISLRRSRALRRAYRCVAG